MNIALRRLRKPSGNYSFFSIDVLVLASPATFQTLDGVGDTVEAACVFVNDIIGFCIAKDRFIDSAKNCIEERGVSVKKALADDECVDSSLATRKTVLVANDSAEELQPTPLTDDWATHFAPNSTYESVATGPMLRTQPDL